MITGQQNEITPVSDLYDSALENSSLLGHILSHNPNSDEPFPGFVAVIGTLSLFFIAVAILSCVCHWLIVTRCQPRRSCGNHCRQCAAQYRRKGAPVSPLPTIQEEDTVYQNRHSELGDSIIPADETNPIQ